MPLFSVWCNESKIVKSHFPCHASQKAAAACSDGFLSGSRNSHSAERYQKLCIRSIRISARYRKILYLLRIFFLFYTVHWIIFLTDSAYNILITLYFAVKRIARKATTQAHGIFFTQLFVQGAANSTAGGYRSRFCSAVCINAQEWRATWKIISCRLDCA